MPKSYKVLGYVLFSAGLLLLSFALFSVFYRVILAVPFSVCGVIFAAGGIVGVLWDYWSASKIQVAEQVVLRERRKRQERYFHEIAEIQKLIAQIRTSGTYLSYSTKKLLLSKTEKLQNEIATFFDAEEANAEINRIREKLNFYKETILNYNKVFLEQKRFNEKLDEIETLIDQVRISRTYLIHPSALFRSIQD